MCLVVRMWPDYMYHARNTKAEAPELSKQEHYVPLETALRQ